MADNGVSPQRARAVAALLSSSSRTVAEAALAAGVGARTLQRWLNEDASFQQQVRRAQDEAVQRAVMRLVAGVERALDVLQSLMSDEGVHPSVRARAADSWLRHTLEYGELRDLQERVARLEAAHGVEH